MKHLEFAAEVLRKLLQIRATLNEGPSPRRVEVDTDVVFWQRVQHLIEGEDLRNGGRRGDAQTAFRM